MSKMLTLTGDGLTVAARLFDLGQSTRAAGVLATLESGTETPADRVKVLRAAAQVALTQERFRKARKLLREAIALAPADAALWHDLGRAYEDDPHGSDRQAARRYKKATTLNADDPKHRAALGRAMVRINETTSGVKVLLRAAAAAPADAEVLGVVVEGLREAGRAEDAFRLLSKARFLAPADTRIERLWNRARFDLLAEEQRGNAAPPAPRVIPMLRVFSDAPQKAPERNTARRDYGHTPTSHIARLRAFRGDRG